MSHITIDSYCYIQCADAEHLRVISGYVEDLDSFESPFEFDQDSSMNMIRLSIDENELSNSIEDAMESFAMNLFSDHGLSISGYLIEDTGEGKYRLEFKPEGQLDYSGSEWLLEYSLKQISDIHRYAEEKYPRKCFTE